jgi:hypothetical protein
MSNGRKDFQDTLNKALQEAFELGDTRRERAGTTYGKGAVVPNSHRKKLLDMYNTQSSISGNRLVSDKGLTSLLELRDHIDSNVGMIADIYAKAEGGEVAISKIENISAQIDSESYNKVTIDFSGKIIILPKTPRIE